MLRLHPTRTFDKIPPLVSPLLRKGPKPSLRASMIKTVDL